MREHSIPVRWQAGIDRIVRVYSGEAMVDHPLALELCPACADPLGNGEEIALLALGPGDDPELRAKHASGRFYSAEAIACHAPCIGAGPAHRREDERLAAERMKAEYDADNVIP